jgi:hypothetical protein
VAIIWDLDEDEEGNVQHIAEHGIEKDGANHGQANHARPQADTGRSGEVPQDS